MHWLNFCFCCITKKDTKNFQRHTEIVIQVFSIFSLHSEQSENVVLHSCHLLAAILFALCYVYCCSFSL